MAFEKSRVVILGLIGVSIAILIPGLIMPVLTIRGVLTKDGIASVAPMMIEKGLNEDTVNSLKSMMNPAMVGLLQATGGDLRKMIIEKLTPQVTAGLQQGVDDVEVYEQTRSILSAVNRLYEVGSPVPATLILLFSVVVPFGKAALVAWAMFMRDAGHRLRTLRFVEAIAKWSMADVFVVGIFIAYLAAQASQTTPGSSEPALVAFTADFGPGFYWFAGYCLFSLATQQYSARLAARAAD
jgi:hypothetical protein